jgi:hypothetical protein
MPSFIDLTSQRFFRLRIVSKAENIRKKVAWNCLCDCGTKIVVIAGSLTSGNTKSCGCYNLDSIVVRNLKHGFSNRGNVQREYRSWQAMKSRCFNQKDKAWHRYGGRGIGVCDEWKGDFNAFLEDMGACPTGLTLDRIDNDGNYGPSNCRWASRKKQAENRKGNLYVLDDGDRITIKELADRWGVPASTLYHHVRYGGDPVAYIQDKNNKGK